MEFTAESAKHFKMFTISTLWSMRKMLLWITLRADTVKNLSKYRAIAAGRACDVLGMNAVTYHLGEDLPAEAKGAHPEPAQFAPSFLWIYTLVFSKPIAFFQNCRM